MGGYLCFQVVALRAARAVHAPCVAPEHAVRSSLQSCALGSCSYIWPFFLLLCFAQFFRLVCFAQRMGHISCFPGTGRPCTEVFTSCVRKWGPASAVAMSWTAVRPPPAGARRGADRPSASDCRGMGRAVTQGPPVLHAIRDRIPHGTMQLTSPEICMARTAPSHRLRLFPVPQRLHHADCSGASEAPGRGFTRRPAHCQSGTHVGPSCHICTTTAQQMEGHTGT